MPTVSVVVIFFNEERYLEEAAHSVLDQTLADWELILVDDGSTDGSTRIARDLAARDERVHYVEHPGHANRGMSATRNVGAANAKAPYLAFLDADDRWPPERLAEQVALLDGMPDVAILVGAIMLWHSWDPASTQVDRILLTGGTAQLRVDPPEALLAMHPLGSGPSAGVTGLVRRSAFDAVGGFEGRFRGLFEDQAFLAKILLRYPIYISPQTWYYYRQHDASCVVRTSRLEYWRRRGAYLNWLETRMEPHTDTRVVAAVRRARQELPYRQLTAPLYELFDRLPHAIQRRLRLLAGRRVDH